MKNFDKWRTAGIFSYLAYLEQEEIEQFLGLLGKEESEIQENLDKENYDEFKLLESGLLEIKNHKKGFRKLLIVKLLTLKYSLLYICYIIKA